MMTRFILLAAAWLACCVPVQAQQQHPFQADNSLSVSSELVPNNATPVVVRASYANMYGVGASNNGASVAYVKLYNAASLAACGTGTPQARYMIPAAAAGGLLIAPLVNGDAYSFGIVMCVTTGIADSDATAPAASTYLVNVHWK